MGRRLRLDPTAMRELADHWLSRSISQWSAYFGVHRNTIFYARKKLKLPARPRTGKPSPLSPEGQVRLAGEWGRYSLPVLARRFALSVPQIRRLGEKLRLPDRPLGRPRTGRHPIRRVLGLRQVKDRPIPKAYRVSILTPWWAGGSQP